MIAVCHPVCDKLLLIFSYFIRSVKEIQHLKCLFLISGIVHHDCYKECGAIFGLIQGSNGHSLKFFYITGKLIESNGHIKILHYALRIY